MIDLHCHILPGLDDGADSLKTSLEMARIAVADGIGTIVATPHFFRDGRSSRKFGTIEEACRQLALALAEQGIPLEIKAGGEVHLAHDLMREIRTHRKDLVLNGSAYIFLEFPAHHVYPGIKNLLFELMMEKLVPIIAHPERNSVFARHPSLLYGLVEMGALVQVNAGSLLGRYGREAREMLLRLLEWKMVHFLATDAHNTDSLPPRLSEAVRRVESEIGAEAARSLVVDNPLAVLEDRELPYQPRAVDPGLSRKSLNIILPGFLRAGRSGQR